MTDKVTEACHRIEELWNETDGKCYVSFSGGKDSTVLLALIKLCQELYTVGDIPAVFSNTGIELGVTVNFVKWVKENYYRNVVIIHPSKPFDTVLKEDGKPLLSKVKSNLLDQYQRNGLTEALNCLLINGETRNHAKMRNTRIADIHMHVLHEDFNIRPSPKCCEWMKKKPFEEYSKANGMKGSLQGIRTAEGGARRVGTERRLANGGRLCTWIKHGQIQKAPIIDWTEDDVNEFIRGNNVPLSDAYTKYGFDRTGCMACPYAKTVAHDLKYLHDYEPNRYKAAMYWLKDVYIAQNVPLYFDQSYERERESGGNGTNP